MYVAVKGGETAIAHSLNLVADKRRGDRDVAELSLEQIEQQLGLAVDRVMTEGSCYDRSLAALAIKQARGDLIEAIFLLRAYRTTLPRFAHAEPVNTGAMAIHRRISATFKDLPGGQLLLDVPVFFCLPVPESDWCTASTLVLIESSPELEGPDTGPPRVLRMCEWMARTAAPVRGPNTLG